jgi:CarD family transcriptional regulator
MNGNGVFHIGDKVVYPNHGVGTVEQIASLTIGTQIQKFYVLSIAASNLKVRVPFNNVDSVGMRPVVRNGEVEKIVDYLSSGECINAADWKDRFKENSDRMRTGSLTDVAAVLKSLLILGQAKSLSFREKKMLERAKYLLVSEMATARNTTSETAEGLVVKSLAKAKLTFPVMTEKFE